MKPSDKDRAIFVRVGRNFMSGWPELVVLIGVFPSLLRRDELGRRILVAFAFEAFIRPDRKGGWALHLWTWSDLDEITRRRAGL